MRGEKKKEKKERKVKRGGYWQPADYICRLLSCTGLWKVVRPGMERWAAGGVLAGRAGR